MRVCDRVCVCVVGGDSPSSIIYRKPSCICDFQRRAEGAQPSNTDLPPPDYSSLLLSSLCLHHLTLLSSSSPSLLFLGPRALSSFFSASDHNPLINLHSFFSASSSVHLPPLSFTPSCSPLALCLVHNLSSPPLPHHFPSLSLSLSYFFFISFLLSPSSSTSFALHFHDASRPHLYSPHLSLSFPLLSSRLLFSSIVTSISPLLSSHHPLSSPPPPAPVISIQKEKKKGNGRGGKGDDDRARRRRRRSVNSPQRVNIQIIHIPLRWISGRGSRSFFPSRHDFPIVLSCAGSFDKDSFLISFLNVSDFWWCPRLLQSLHVLVCGWVLTDE